MTELQFIKRVAAAARAALPASLHIRRDAALLYRVPLNARLEVAPEILKAPKRGESAFATDLSISEQLPDETYLPRVVIECKVELSTHDVLTYSAKARRHKQVYPYLRYGLFVAVGSSIPGRFFTHNEGFDFAVTFGGLATPPFRKIVASVLRKEVRASRRLWALAFDKQRARIYRTPVSLRDV